MVNILNLITIGEKQYLVVDKDPATDGGLSAEIGSLAVTDEGGVGKAYIKVGSGQLDWDKVSTASDGGIALGNQLRLAIYNTVGSGQTVDDVVVQNSQNISVSIEAQASRSAAIEYTIPNPGNSITAASFVLTEGAQSISGDKTFNDDVIVDGDLTVNGSLTYLNTTNTEITDKSVILNKGGAADSANGSGIEFEEDGSVTGWMQVSADRLGFDLKAPAASDSMVFDGSLLSADRTFKMPDESGTAVIRADGDDGVQYQLSYYNSANAITSNADLVYDDNLDQFKLGYGTSTNQSIKGAAALNIESENDMTIRSLDVANDIYLDAGSGAVRILENSGANEGLFLKVQDLGAGVMKGTVGAPYGTLHFVSGDATPNTNIFVFENMAGLAGLSMLLPSNGVDAINPIISADTGMLNFSSNEHVFNFNGSMGAVKLAIDTGSLSLPTPGAMISTFNSEDLYVYADGEMHLRSDVVKVEAHTTEANLSIVNPGGDAVMELKSLAASSDSILENTMGLLYLSGFNVGGSAEVRFGQSGMHFASMSWDNVNSRAVLTSSDFEMILSSLIVGHLAAPASETRVLKIDELGEVYSDYIDLALDGGTSVLPIANGGTNSNLALNNDRLMISSSGSIVEHSALVSGQVYFGDANGLPAQSADLYWDNANSRLGIGNGAPARELDVTGDAIVRGSFRLEDAAGAANREFSSGVASTTDGSYATVQTIAIPADSCVLITAHVVGRRTGGTAGSAGDSAVYVRTARVKNVGGTVSIQNLQSDYTSEEPAQSLWDGTMTVSGTDVLVRVRGATNNNVSWHCWSEIQVQS